jgi:hypothetical protein
MSETKTDRTAPLDSVAIVENFWREVWQLQNPDAIDRLVHEDFVITSGGRDIVGKASFKGPRLPVPHRRDVPEPRWQPRRVTLACDRL